MELWSAERVYIKGRFEKDWGLMVDEDGVIQAIGPRQQLVAKARQVHHYPDRILLPSFINPSNQGFTRVFRGLADFNTSFHELRHKLVWPLARAVDMDLYEAVYRIAFAEMALSGIGTVGEFHYLHNGDSKSPESGSHAKKIIEIALEFNMRICLVYAFFDQGSSESAKAFIQTLDTGRTHFEELQATYKDHPLVTIMPGIYSLEHTSPEAIIAAAELAEKYNTKLHVKLAEREQELESSQRQFGTTPLRAMEKMGVLSDRLVIINGTLLDEEELGMMRKYDIPAIICPNASLAKGDDFPNTYGLLREEIPFAVGSSSAAMNAPYSIPDDIRLLEFSQRSMQKTMNVLCSQTEISSLWELGTIIPAETLGLPISQLMPGSPADFMLIEAGDTAFRPHFNFENNHFMNQLIFGWSPHVNISHLIVHGKSVVRNGYMETDLTPSYQRLERWSQAIMRSMDRANRDQTDVETTQEL